MAETAEKNELVGERDTNCEKKREMGVGKCCQRIKVNSGYIALTGTSFGGGGGLFSPKTKPRLLRLKLGFSLVC